MCGCALRQGSLHPTLSSKFFWVHSTPLNIGYSSGFLSNDTQKSVDFIEFFFGSYCGVLCVGVFSFCVLIWFWILVAF